MRKKEKSIIPPGIAANVLFLSDRTCCVCKKKNYLQIHHIDEKPSNFDIDNLAVLCLDCHTETQIKGGFFRKLDSHQVKLYRDNWLTNIAKKRSQEKTEISISTTTKTNVYEDITAFYKEIGQVKLLAFHYDSEKKIELRDKYIEKILKNNPSDEDIIYFRKLQNKLELIPKKVIRREIKRLSNEKNWFNLGRLYASIGKYKIAVENYVKGCEQYIKTDNLFTVAYHIKEMLGDGIIDELFKIELQKSIRKKELWHQLRCLEELGKESKIRDLLIKNEKIIKKSKNISLKIQLAIVQGDDKTYLKLMKEDALRDNL